MAALDTAPRAPLFAGLRRFLDPRVEQAMAARARFRTYLATHAELAGLSDRELADIGVSRADISTLAYEHAYGAGRTPS